jgi:hypothetical protein
MPSSDTQFKPGQSGNPGGKPVGARNRLSAAFIKTLADDFDKGGVEVIEKLRKEQPAQYANVIAKLMPKLMELSGLDGGDIPLSGVVKFVKSSDSD